MKRFLWAILLIAVFIRPVQLLYSQRDIFFSSGYEKRYELLKTLYYSSQYVKKKNPGIIPDDALESFAGGIFLKGLNPILIVHDQPPLGRYIIGLSIFLFDNPNTITIPLLIFAGTGIFLISKIIIRNSLFSIIPLAIFINEPLFLNKLIYTPLLEPLQLPFIILSVYFFIKGITGKKPIRWFIACSLMLGFVISIRFFVLGAGLLFGMILYFLIEKKVQKKIIQFLFTLPLALLVLILSYVKTLQNGYSVFQIFGIQKYILFYHSSKFTLPFSFWDLLLFNRWHTWWGTYAISSDDQWIIIWPVATLISGAFLILALLKKIFLNPSEKIVFLSVGALCAMFSVGYTSTRYFLPVLPLFYILAIAFVTKYVLRVIKP